MTSLISREGSFAMATSESRITQDNLSALEADDHLEDQCPSETFAVQEGRRLSLSESSDDDYDDDDDDDEFGGASDDEAPNESFLGDLESQYQEEADSLRLKLLSSRLQPKLPMGLDNEKHDDIGDLTTTPTIPSSGSATASMRGGRINAASSRSQRSIYLLEEEDDDVENSDFSDEEFGDAGLQDTPDSNYLRESLEDESPTRLIPKLMITPSVLQSRMPAGLDNEKHEEITDLVDSKRQTRSLKYFGASSSSRRSRSLSLHDEDIYDDLDEFGGGEADESDQSVVRGYLRRYRKSIVEQDGLGLSQLVITPSQLQARLPSGLDSEKHEDMGDLLLSRHKTPAYGNAEFNAMQGKPGSRTNDRRETTVLHNKDKIGRGVGKHDIEDDDDDDGEFGDGSDDDVIVNKCLQQARDSFLMEDDTRHYRTKSVPRITPSQLQARIPAGLDKEKHEDISDLIDSRHEFDKLLDDDLNDDDDEFGNAETTDVAVNRFLQDSTHSIPFDYDELMNGHGSPNSNDDSNGDYRNARIVGIDGEKHEGLSDLDILRSQHSLDTENELQDPDYQEAQEFGKANDSDRPVEKYLDRWKESFNEDGEFDDDIEYVELKGEPSYQNLDEDKHEDLAELNKNNRSAHLQFSGILDDDDDDEFEQAGDFEGPVHKYLMAQSSFSEDNLLAEALSLESQVASDLDDERHDDLGGFLVSSVPDGSSSDEFNCASSLDRPSRCFMKKQISIQDDDFFDSDGEVESD